MVNGPVVGPCSSLALQRDKSQSYLCARYDNNLGFYVLLLRTLSIRYSAALVFCRGGPRKDRLLLLRNIRWSDLEHTILVGSSTAETLTGAKASRDTYTGLEDQGQKLPSKAWTLHGLWPDFCNGSFTQYCDLSRQFDPSPSPNTTNGLPNGTFIPPYKGPNIGTFLEPFGKADLLSYMQTFWINQGAPNADFWGHEFSKHATVSFPFQWLCFRSVLVFLLHQTYTVRLSH